MALQVTLAEQP